MSLSFFALQTLLLERYGKTYQAFTGCQIGEGAHGVVLKAKSVETGEIVALKKVPLRRLEDGIPNTILREIKALQEIDHQNVRMVSL